MKTGLIVLAVALGVVAAAPAAEERAGAKPNPATAKKAIALVRSHPDTNEAASPFKREIRWTAEWRGDRWWVIGLFQSEWGVRFVVDATIWHGRVYAYIKYAMRPRRAWVRAKARKWRLPTMYTRLTRAAAIDVVKENGLGGTEEGGPGLDSYTVLGAASKLVVDASTFVGWYFAFYVEDPATGKRLVLTVASGSGRHVPEGSYVGGYGFGATPHLYERVPLNRSDWVRAVAKARGWQASNVP